MNCPEAQATLSSGANNSLYVHSWGFSAWGDPGVLRYGQKQCLTSGDKGKLGSLAPIPTISPNLTHTQMLPLVACYPLWFLFKETDVFSEAEPASAEAAFSLACVTVASGYPPPPFLTLSVWICRLHFLSFSTLWQILAKTDATVAKCPVLN